MAEVVESKQGEFQKGAVVVGNLPWQQYTVHAGRGLCAIDPKVAPLSYHLGIHGMPGRTAFFGLLHLGQPKAGETVVVSGAAGAVGTVVGQIAKLKGCRVIGIAGTDEKVAYLKKELAFDEAINYKTIDDINKAVAQACPDGVDVYFDNVGGAITDAVLLALNKFGRIAICGQIAFYNNTSPATGMHSESILLRKSALMKGFIVNGYAIDFGAAALELVTWLKEGKLQYHETVKKALKIYRKLSQGFLHERISASNW